MSCSLKIKSYGLILLAYVVSITSAFSQGKKAIKIKGEASVLIQDNFTKKEYESIAYLEATQKALHDAFGAAVFSTYETYEYYIEKSKSIDSHVSAREHYIHTYPNGVWMKDEKEPVYEEVKDKNGNHWMKCLVTGLAREIETAKAQFTVYTLDGINTEMNRTTDFVHKEQGYLYLKSPEDGYLICFYDDMKIVQRCLPYSACEEQQVTIEKNKDYIFFSPEHTNYNVGTEHIDEIEFRTDRMLEYNQLYILFSPTPFEKYQLEQFKRLKNGYRTFPYMERGKFHEWMQGNRIKNDDLQMQIIGMIIKKN